MSQAKSAWGSSWASSWAGAWGPVAAQEEECSHTSGRPVAVQGVGYKPLVMAMQGFCTVFHGDKPLAGGTHSKRPVKVGRPVWHYVPFHPVPARRSRKKRDADLLFLGV